MLGLVLSDNLFTLFIFWELTSISSYLLIGFKYRYQTSRDAALQALLVTAGGGLAMLAGFVLLSASADSATISTIINDNLFSSSSSMYGAVLILILLGAFAKSAQFPFHFWLPIAMEAPTPVSAILHSATMVKGHLFAGPFYAHSRRDNSLDDHRCQHRRVNDAARRLSRVAEARSQTHSGICHDQRTGNDCVAARDWN